MTDLDKKIKGLSDELHIPEEYDKRIEETLSSIPEKEESYRSSGKWHKIGGMGLFLWRRCFDGRCVS